jgi:hypothetical protein
MEVTWPDGLCSCHKSSLSDSHLRLRPGNNYMISIGNVKILITCMYVCAPYSCVLQVEVRGQLEEISSLLVPSGSQWANSDHQAPWKNY